MTKREGRPGVTCMCPKFGSRGPYRRSCPLAVVGAPLDGLAVLGLSPRVRGNLEPALPIRCRTSA